MQKTRKSRFICSVWDFSSSFFHLDRGLTEEVGKESGLEGMGRIRGEGNFRSKVVGWERREKRMRRKKMIH